MVALGCADGYFEYGIHCWDIAAGDVMVREAGGITMYPTGTIIGTTCCKLLVNCTWYMIR